MKSDFVDSPWEIKNIQNNYNPHPDVLNHIDHCHNKIEDMIDPGQIEFLVIPGRYLRADDLTYSEKFLMSYIAMTDQKHHCWAKNKTFAKWMGVSEQTIKNMMASLKKKGYIKLISYDGRKRVIKCSR
jgi:DNA-binding MarR family transcriptional regulator